MASLKFPDISVSAVEAGKAMKKISDALAKASREQELKSLTFKIQVVSVFPVWYIFHTSKGVITVNEETIKTALTFTADTYTKSAIKATITGLEEKHIAKYQALLKYKYKELPTYDISATKTHYILEVDTK